MSRTSRLLVLLSVALLSPSIARAQIAGVEVDPAGVLRLKVFDARLTQQRVAAARKTLASNIARVSGSRKISLNRLEAALAQRGQSDDMRFLAGLTRIEQVFFYPETGDIVIAGPAEGYALDASGRVIGVSSGRSVLELQDLVVALRAFSPNGGGPNQIRVSIDPTPEGLQRMQQFIRSPAFRVRGRTQREGDRVAKLMRESLGLQTVSVGGISPQTHFAQVLVEADYRMKLIGIGIEQPAVKIISYVARAKPRDVARNAMQRWFFTPNYECVRVSDDEYAMELVGDGVKLIGENELVTAAGVRQQSDHVDRASQVFVHSFTENYAALAEKSAVYAQMRNLIDMSIIAAFIQEQDYYGQANWTMEFFGDEERFPVETYQTPEQVESACTAIWKGSTLMTPVGGGVEIQPRLALATDRLLHDEDKKLQQRREAISLEHLQDGQWWWD